MARDLRQLQPVQAIFSPMASFRSPAREAPMAQKVTVALEDDLDGGPADETVRFGFEGTDYETDLSAKNARVFRQQIQPYVQHGRKAGHRPAPRAQRTAAGRQRSGDVRAWAKEHGIALNARGRIPARVVHQYQAAVKARLPRPGRGWRRISHRSPIVSEASPSARRERSEQFADESTGRGGDR
jgi:hypothetical protein